eukprot:jgi/Psemu1/49684/gm1.49684_g
MLTRSSSTTLAALTGPLPFPIASTGPLPHAHPNGPILAAPIVHVATAPAAAKPAPLNDLTPTMPQMPVVAISIGTVIPSTNSLASYSLVVSTDRIRVFPDVNKTQLDLNRKKACPWCFKWNALFNNAWSKQIKSLLAPYNFLCYYAHTALFNLCNILQAYMVSFFLSFATSPLDATKQAVLSFANSRTPIPPPTDQHQEAPNALTTALATLVGLIPVHLPANKLGITSIDTNQTVKFLCFPVTTSAHGNPHYLFGAYVLGAHLLFPCYKSNWYHTNMLTGYCGWSISTTAACVYHFNPNSTTPKLINELPTAHIPDQHPDNPTA